MLRPENVHALRRLVLAVGLWIVLSGTGQLLAQDSYAYDECVQPDATLDDNTVVELFTVDDELEVADVRVSIDITHPWIGDLSISLESPQETTVVLHDQLGIFDDDIVLTWDDAGVLNETEPFDCDCAMRPSGPGKLADFDGEVAAGDWSLSVQDVDDADDGTWNDGCLEIDFVPPPEPFLRGDADGDGEVEPIADSVLILRWQYGTGAAPFCMDAADVDDDGRVIALIDVVHLLSWAYRDGAAPPDPGPEECGDDPTEDGTECDEASCE